MPLISDDRKKKMQVYSTALALGVLTGLTLYYRGQARGLRWNLNDMTQAAADIDVLDKMIAHRVANPTTGKYSRFTY